MSEKEIYEKVSDILHELSNKDAEYVIAKILEEYDYRMCANIVREESETCIMKSDGELFEDSVERGFIPLRSILNDYFEILNCDVQGEYESVEVDVALRLENKKELTENKRDKELIWYTEDENIDLNKIIIGFKTKQERDE